MGTPCEINSILKLNSTQGYPKSLELDRQHRVIKQSYRLMPIDVPIPLVDENWIAHADIIIDRLTWESQQTTICFKISRVYSRPWTIK